MKNCIVIGGGIIGLCSAYYLKNKGHQVTVIDQSNITEGASFVNAGYLAPSHIIPLSAPGVIKKGLKWMLNPASPLYIKPRMDLDFLKWAWAFNKSANTTHVAKSISTIKDIAVLSQELYDEFKAKDGFNFHYEKKGLLTLCQTEKMFNAEIKIAAMAEDVGLEVGVLNQVELAKLQPEVSINALGAIYYKCDSHTTPNEFMADLKNNLEASGVTFLTHERVTDLEYKNNEIASLTTTLQHLKADEYILAAGSWSALLSKKIGLNLLLQAGKGYRINTTRRTHITYPTILAEAKVAITPMNGFTRFGGTMELVGINSEINKVRVNAIANSVAKYFPNVLLTEEEKLEATYGLRPVSPDGLPYIGRSKTCSNLTIATGHAMMGWSMGTATGKLVSEIISNEKPSLNTDPFHPDRVF